MKKLLSLIVLVGLVSMVMVSAAAAQTPEPLKLGLSRDFGYGGFGNDIQGLFTAKIANPPANLTKVDFYIDSDLMGTVSAAPFNLQFNTDSYPLGTHTISAVGTTADGTQIKSNQVTMNFVAAGTGMKSVVRIIVPVILLVIVIALVSVFLPIVLSRGKLANTPLGAERKYGVGGGAICPKCGRPFPIRLWWINLGASKFDRCPYCGKWSMVRPRSITELREAEAAELANAETGVGIAGESKAEKLDKDLDDSRFQDM